MFGARGSACEGAERSVSAGDATGLNPLTRMQRVCGCVVVKGVVGSEDAARARLAILRKSQDARVQIGREKESAAGKTPRRSSAWWSGCSRMEEPGRRVWGLAVMERGGGSGGGGARWCE